MKLLGEKDVVTPIDDICQFDPAWRASVANYLFDCGVTTKEDLKNICDFGGIPVIVEKEIDNNEEQNKDRKKTKTKKKKVPKKKKNVNVIRPIPPFYKHPCYRCFAADKWIMGLIELIDSESKSLPSTMETSAIKLARRWYQEIDHEAAMKKRLEPLLLTEVDMDIIAEDLLGFKDRRPAVEAYERLYFNCRDENWNRNPSAQLIQRFAMPYGPLKTFLRKYEHLDKNRFVEEDGRPLAKESDVWRAIAATQGYEALMYVWKWDNLAGKGMDKKNAVDRMIEKSWTVAMSNIFSILYKGEISNEDIARVLSALTAQSKKISDDRNGRSDSGENDTTKALMAVLSMVAPKMVVFSEEDDKARNDEIQSRIASQLAISKQEIEDKGEQVNAEVIDAQISDAIST